MPRRGLVARAEKRDKVLEAMIDMAGRSDVFEKVRSWGYGSDPIAPKDVWERAARDVIAERAT